MNLLLVGFGTVGQGLAELLIEKKESLSRDYGSDFKVVGIADMLKGTVCDPKGIDLRWALDTVRTKGFLSGGTEEFRGKDTLALIRTVRADAMLEATYTDIRTAEPATTHIRAALERGMHVVTSNKGPLALHYRELQELARKMKREFLFEGTVMSGTPLLNLIRETLSGAAIREIRGILNGTTNYILTRMEEGLAYDEALKEAQGLGYAEAVPDADVLGWDALAKVTILANVVFGADKKPFDSPCEGIVKITAADVAAAKNGGKRYKLIGRVWREDGDVRASVSPQPIDLSHPLAGVMGATNAVTIATDTVGEITVIGPGAGRRETGYSMLIDLIHIARKR